MAPQGNGFIEWDPNLANEPPDSTLISLCVLFSVLICLSTGSRIILRLYQLRALYLADCFVIISMAFNLTANILEIEMLKRGFGRHLQFIETPNVLYMLRVGHYLILLANIALWSVKLSVSFFILNVIRDTHKMIKWVAYVLIVITTLSSIGQAIFWGLRAKPLRRLWTPDIPGEVQPIEIFVNATITFTVINSVTDLFYALAPIYFFGRLHLDLTKKLVLIGLTGTGLVAFASSIVRVSFDADFYNPDSTHSLYRVYLCTVIERNVAEIVADLPASFAIIRSLRKKTITILSRTARTSNKGSGGAQSGGRSNRIKSTSEGGHDGDRDNDELPLREWPQMERRMQGIRKQTSIDISTHHENMTPPGLGESQKDLLHPWN